jgi:esterase/lipase superfamily enzyme
VNISADMTKRRKVCLAASFAAATLAGACASRPGPEALRPVAIAAPQESVSVLLATTRERSPTEPDAFTVGRSSILNYQAYRISIPPLHTTGKIEWPAEEPGDPQASFVVTASAPLDLAEVRSAVGAQSNPSGEVAVFVHGYNTSYEEAVFRVAQLAHDMRFAGKAIAFAWPSSARIAGYVADRESSTYSRDLFEKFLNDLAATPGVNKIDLVAHSMGNWLAVETLRQARLRGHSRFIAKLNEVVLLSPDVDVDVFRADLDDIGRLNAPITMLISSDDRALRISQRLAGGVPRVGNLDGDDPRLAAIERKYDLRIVDLSKFSGNDFSNHSKFLTALPQLKALAAAHAGDAEESAFDKGGVFVYDAGNSVLQLPDTMKSPAAAQQ